MAIIYAVPALALSAKSNDEFNYGMAGVGAISYAFVEGAFLIREARKCICFLVTLRDIG